MRAATGLCEKGSRIWASPQQESSYSKSEQLWLHRRSLSHSAYQQPGPRSACCCQHNNSTLNSSWKQVVRSGGRCKFPDMIVFHVQWHSCAAHFHCQTSGKCTTNFQKCHLPFPVSIHYLQSQGTNFHQLLLICQNKTMQDGSSIFIVREMSQLSKQLHMWFWF